MELNDEMLKDIGYVQGSTYRTNVMKTLTDGKMKIPTNIAKDACILVNHISNILSDLKEHDLVECVNPEAKKGRLYRHTSKGALLVKYL